MNLTLLAIYIENPKRIFVCMCVCGVYSTACNSENCNLFVFS